MKTLRLNLDALSVTSFATADTERPARGCSINTEPPYLSHARGACHPGLTVVAI